MEFYDPGTSNLRELWDCYLAEPVLAQDTLVKVKDEEWSNALDGRGKSTLEVVLRDRLMTDAAGGSPRPIKSEHSYASLLISSPPMSPATPGPSPQTPNSNHASYADMEDECFPAIAFTAPSSYSPSLSSSTNLPKKGKQETTTKYNVKDELITDTPGDEAPRASYQLISPLLEERTAMEPCENLHFAQSRSPFATEDEDDDQDEDEDYCQDEPTEEERRVDRDVTEQRTDTPKQSLSLTPPTPPSSASSDTDSLASATASASVSASCSPDRQDSQSWTHVQSNLRNSSSFAPRLYLASTGHSSSRQPIHTPLVSCQPKGSTGALALTDEEKKILRAEGYPVPTKLPLSKQEEKTLKRVRRKIKNKISAQESRRKKKEYMDGLERRVTTLTNENSSYRSRVLALEDANRELFEEVQRLQAFLQLRNS